MGAAFIVFMPVLLNNVSSVVFGGTLSGDTISNMELMIFGGSIIFFLIVEPHGFARLWQIAKQKLRVWPFPY
jgi:branched-chain amino acid transport system permease protein